MTAVKLVAIAALCVIGAFALYNGVDSALTGTICAIIGGVAGYEFGKKKES